MSNPDQQHKLVAIMFTDIVGYTSMMAANEVKALAQIADQRCFLSMLIEEYNGELLKEMGDGTLTTFSSASQAARCAQQIQKHAMNKGINLRIGLHIGEVIVNNGDVFGDGVNLTSRIESVAMSGGISISETFCHAIRSQSEFSIYSQGKKKLKGINAPVTVYALLPTQEQVTTISLFQQLKQRNVFNAAILYLCACGIILHLFDTSFQATTNIEKLISFVMFTGFPLIITLFWFFELTPHGLTRQADISLSERKLLANNLLVNNSMLIMLILFCYLAFNRFMLPLSEQASINNTVSSKDSHIKRNPIINGLTSPSTLSTQSSTSLIQSKALQDNSKVSSTKQLKTASASNNCQAIVLTPASVKASSNNGRAYSAKRAIDGRLNTGWWANSNQVNNQWFEITFKGKVLIKKIALLNGFPASWRDNARLKQVKIIFDDGSFEIHQLEDNIQRLQPIKLKHKTKTKTVNLHVMKLYPGLSFKAPGINEIKSYGCSLTDNSDD